MSAALKFADALAKGQPSGPAAVHQSTALGNEGRKRFQAFLTAPKPVKVDDSAQVLDAQAAALKRDTGATWSLPMKFAKADPDQQIVFGFTSVVTKDGQIVVDKQGDMIPVHELEKAVYKYCLDSRAGDDMHMESRANTSRLIESMVFTKEKCDAIGMPLPVVDPATGARGEAWWAGYKVDDPNLWAAYKRGERPEFSIGGAAVPVQV